MSYRRARLPFVLAGLLLLPLAAAATGASLDTAYAAILRGDFDTARTTLGELVQQPDTAPAARQVQQWLEAHERVAESRQELKDKTFAWYVEQGQAALDTNLYLALSMAERASTYARDPEAFCSAPWVVTLTARCEEEARRHAAEERWTKALTFYALLGRIHEDREEYETLRDAAARHARLEFAYEDREKMERRIQGVTEDLLIGATRMIDRMYYQDPDFRALARGALENLLTVSETSKLYAYLDGLANPMLRQHFGEKLRELEREIDRDSRYDYKNLLRLFKDVKRLNAESVELPDGMLVMEFVEGMLGKLDEFTGMIWPVDASEFDKAMMGGFEGVGIQLGVDEMTNRLKVVTPLESSPALEAGIQPDDLIVAVDGEPTTGWTTDDAVRNIMGPGGSQVVLTIFRPRTGENIPFKLTRRRIELTTVRGIERLSGTTDEWNYMLDKEMGVAYIRLTNFLPKSELELRQALASARQQGMKGLVLDVRHNPGGLLDVAINIVSTFLSEGEVVATRGRAQPDQHERVNRGRALYDDIPLVILVNEGSASASEILAGALQDHHRGIVLGDRTFGKGSVQHVRGLGGDARLKLTTALYYLPSGRSPHRAPDADAWGVDPDWMLQLTPKELLKVIEQQRETYIIHNEKATENAQLSDEERQKALAALKDEESEEDDEPPLLSQADIELLESEPHTAPDVDPQLETALLLVRVKLAAQVPWPKDLAAACKTEPPRP